MKAKVSRSAILVQADELLRRTGFAATGKRHGAVEGKVDSGSPDDDADAAARQPANVPARPPGRPVARLTD